MNQTDMTDSFAEISASLTTILDQGLQSSMSLLQSLNKIGMSLLTQAATPGNAAGAAKASDRSCGCTIPTPCWMPQPLGDLTALVCPGGTATLRVLVTNCGIQETAVSIEAKATAIKFTIDPPSITLGPMERSVITLSAKIPASASSGQEFESLVWIHGCREHYLRYIVKVATKGVDCCHEIDVNDCPDLIHHWYDHFYCRRSCSRQIRER